MLKYNIYPQTGNPTLYFIIFFLSFFELGALPWRRRLSDISQKPLGNMPTCHNITSHTEQQSKTKAESLSCKLIRRRQSQCLGGRKPPVSLLSSQLMWSTGPKTNIWIFPPIFRIYEHLFSQHSARSLNEYPGFDYRECKKCCTTPVSRPALWRTQYPTQLVPVDFLWDKAVGAWSWPFAST
jgi:hypothetical protein